MSIGADGVSSNLAGCTLCASDKMVAKYMGCAAEFPACCEMAAEVSSMSGIAANLLHRQDGGTDLREERRRCVEELREASVHLPKGRLP
ncbi:unnamed protein product [Lampetra planeri]